MEQMLFVLQKHNALVAGEHLDLRIQIPDNKKMMASWAIPRAIIPGIGTKVLAVRTNDHSISWMNFKGNIPKGNYGAGEVKILQKGKINIILWNPSHIIFELEGKPLDGKYSLVKFENAKIKNKKKEQDLWLFIKIGNK